MLKRKTHEELFSHRNKLCKCFMPTPPNTTVEEQVKEKILKEIDFLSDHWIKGDDRPPFSFGGWRDEVAHSLLEIYKEFASHQHSQLKEAVELLNKEVPVDSHQASISLAILGGDKLEDKINWIANVSSNFGYNNALKDVLALLTNKEEDK